MEWLVIVAILGHTQAGDVVVGPKTHHKVFNDAHEAQVFAGQEYKATKEECVIFYLPKHPGLEKRLTDLEKKAQAAKPESAKAANLSGQKWLDGIKAKLAAPQAVKK